VSLPATVRLRAGGHILLALPVAMDMLYLGSPHPWMAPRAAVEEAAAAMPAVGDEEQAYAALLRSTAGVIEGDAALAARDAAYP